MSTTVTRFALHPIKEHVGGFAPVFARTSTVHAPIDPVAYDCVKLIFVRSGSAILFSEFGEKPGVQTSPSSGCLAEIDEVESAALER